MNTVITAEGLGKKYKIGHFPAIQTYPTFRDALVQNTSGFLRSAANIFRGGPMVAGETFEDIWALRDVSFSIEPGEIVGIIGKNGSGKSTLLKLLSRITEPTTGRAIIRGRVASLLEVGTGFHPELSGRENIFLNGAVLGMTRTDIRKRFDEIVAFAEIDRFLDTPVKRYSSGMYVRLAFAIAAHLEPDILVVDEVLAVGDAEFQKKCLGKMEEVANRKGRTVLFVSHQLAMITSLCERALLLENGRIIFDGDASGAVGRYYGNVGDQWNASPFVGRRLKGEGGAATLLFGAVEPRDGKRAGGIDIRQSFAIKFSYELHHNFGGRVFPFIEVYDSGGRCVFVSAGTFPADAIAGIYESVCVIPGNLLNSDTYSIDLTLNCTQAGNDQGFHERGALGVVIVDPIEETVNEVVRNGYSGPFGGAVRPELKWEVKRLESRMQEIVESPESASR